MLALVNGMDAVSSKLLRNLAASRVYPILFSNWMDAVKSPNPLWMLALVDGMDVVNYKQLKNLTA